MERSSRSDNLRRSFNKRVRRSTARLAFSGALERSSESLRLLQIDQRRAQPRQRILDLMIEPANKTLAALFRFLQRLFDRFLRHLRSLIQLQLGNAHKKNVITIPNTKATMPTSILKTSNRDRIPEPLREEGSE